MNHSKVAVRYAKAYYETCVEQNCLESGRNDIEMLANAINTISDLQLFLNDPVTKPSAKIKALETLLKGKVSALTVKFVSLVVSNKRESHLLDISRNFLYRYKKEKGYSDVTLVCARQLQDSVLANIKSAVEKSYKIKADIQLAIDEELIGGFVLQVDDLQFDSSVATKLKNIKKSLLN